MITNKNLTELFPEHIINKGEGQCQFDEGVDISDDGQSFTVVVDVSEFTPKEGGWNFAVALKVLAGESIDDTARDLTVRLLENDVEFYCSAGDGFGHGTDIGCYADEDTPIPPMVYKLQVKVVGVALPLIEGLVYGGDDVCQGIILNIWERRMNIIFHLFLIQLYLGTTAS